MMSIALLLIRYTFFVPLGIPYVLNDWQFVLLVFSTACIGAAGYIVNDIYDIETDRVNKPDKVLIGKVFSQRFAWNSYYALFLIGGAIGWYLGQLTGKTLYGTINLITGFWLFLYASDFKGRPFLGNVMISFLSAGVLTYPLFFDVLPRLPLEENDAGGQALIILSAYFSFAFIISLFRELIKDMEDREGDSGIGLRTVPIVWGMAVAKIITLLLGLTLSIAFSAIAISGWSSNKVSSLYLLLVLALPSLFATTKVLMAKEAKDYKLISTILKLVMAGAILSIPVITYSSI